MTFFRCDVVERRARFDLAKAEKRQHIVGGLLLAQQRLDEVVKTIRAARDGPAASRELQQHYGLSHEQVSLPV